MSKRHPDHTLTTPGPQVTPGQFELSETKIRDQTLDLRIKMVKKAVEAAAKLSKNFEEMGIPKDDAAHQALNVFDMFLGDNHYYDN